jgi:hypothetical protein
MRRKMSVGLLAAEAIVCAAAAICTRADGNSYAALITFPFEQIASGLRYLSYSGASGNIAAVVLYTCFCCLPLLLFVRRRKKGRHAEDCLLLFLSAALFGAVYLFINPAYFSRIIVPDGMADAGKFAICSTVFSILV